MVISLTWTFTEIIYIQALEDQFEDQKAAASGDYHQHPFPGCTDGIHYNLGYREDIRCHEHL
jgi:hypothetical protein